MGAGAGFPGLPLAIALPGSRVDLLESGRRKCELIERLALAAVAPNARAVAARAEDWARPGAPGREAYDAVTARAVAALSVLLEYASPLLEEGGVLVAWKGARQADEEERAGRAAQLVGMARQDVRAVSPFPGARQRHLHVYRKLRPTPARVPRRAGMALKRPLA